MLRKKSSWKDFYEAQAPNQNQQNYFFWTPYQNTPQPILNVQSTSLYVLSCLFSNCTVSDRGAAIKFSQTGNFLVEFSIFLYCSVGDEEFDGGAIYAGNSNCTLNRVCCFDCCAIGNGAWGQSVRFDLKTSKNSGIILQSSMNSDNKQEEGFGAQICMLYANQNCTSLNVSNSKVSYDSEAIMAFCSLNSNSARYYGCVHLDSSISLAIKQCNIIKNTKGDSEDGIIRYTNNTHNSSIIDCCILENEGSGSWKLFWSSGDTSIIIRNSTLPPSTEYETYGSVIIESTAKLSFIHGFVRTAYDPYCQAGQDSVDGLTPFVPVHFKRCTHHTKYSFHPNPSIILFTAVTSSTAFI